MRVVVQHSRDEIDHIVEESVKRRGWRETIQRLDVKGLADFSCHPDWQTDGGIDPTY